MLRTYSAKCEQSWEANAHHFCIWQNQSLSMSHRRPPLSFAFQPTATSSAPRNPRPHLPLNSRQGPRPALRRHRNVVTLPDLTEDPSAAPFAALTNGPLRSCCRCRPRAGGRPSPPPLPLPRRPGKSRSCVLRASRGRRNPRRRCCCCVAKGRRDVTRGTSRQSPV